VTSSDLRPVDQVEDVELVRIRIAAGQLGLLTQADFVTLLLA
jgi:hypothetical protein